MRDARLGIGLFVCLLLVTVAGFAFFARQSTPPDAPAAAPETADATGSADAPPEAYGDAAERDDDPPSPPPESGVVAAEPAADAAPPARTGAGVSGRVLNAATGEPIEGAQVSAVSDRGGAVQPGVRSGEDGRYEITGLTPGAYRVSAMPVSGFVADPMASMLRMVQLSSGQIAEGVDIRLEPAVAIEGRVLNPAGQPVADAEVLAVYMGMGRSVRSGADGRFSLPDLQQRATVWVAAMKDAHASDWQGPLHLGNEGLSGLELRMESAAAAIAGRVLDRLGAPVRDARVVIESEAMGYDPIHWFARADDRGYFRKTSLPAGEYGLYVVRRQDEDVFPAGDFGDDLPEEAWQALREEVIASFDAHAGLMPPEMRDEVLARLDGADPPAEGLWREGAWGDLLRTVRAAPGETIDGIVLRIDRVDGSGWAKAAPPEGAGSVAGRVVDKDGAPIQNASVFATAESLSASTGDDGSFHISGLSEARQRLSVFHDEFNRKSVEDIALNADDIEIVLERLSMVRGVVVASSSGEPLSAFQIGVKPGRPSGDDLWTTVSTRDAPEGQARFVEHHGEPLPSYDVRDAEGRFQIDSVPKDVATIFVQAPGYAVARHVLEGVRPGARIGDIVVEMAASEPLRGRVLDENGAPIAGARLYLNNPGFVDDLAYPPDAVSDAQGRFGVELSPPPGSRVYAWSDTHTPGSGLVGDGETIIQLESAGAIAGMLLDHGRPWAGAELHLEVEDPGNPFGVRMFDARVEANGSFFVGQIPAGSHVTAAFIHDPSAPESMRVLPVDAYVEANAVTELDLDVAVAADIEELVDYHSHQFVGVDGNGFEELLDYLSHHDIDIDADNLEDLLDHFRQ